MGRPSGEALVGIVGRVGDHLLLRQHELRRAPQTGASRAASRYGNDFQSRVMMRSSLTLVSGAAERVPRRRPFRAQILAHIERARHLVALELPREPIRQRGAVDFADRAGDPHIVAGNRAGEIARHEIALVRPDELVALAAGHAACARTLPGGELDPDVPTAGEVAGRRFRRLGFPRRPLGRQDLVHAVGDDLHVPGIIMYAVIEIPVWSEAPRAPPPPPPPPPRAMRGSVVQRMLRDFLARDAELRRDPS